MTGLKPIKHSVALAVSQDVGLTKVLLVLRPEDDLEFPGVWGLPAASTRLAESLLDVVSRIGAQKLGAAVVPGPRLGLGKQERDSYVLEMELFRGYLVDATPNLSCSQIDRYGVTLYADWRWGDPEELSASALQGSLCSKLLMEFLSKS